MYTSIEILPTDVPYHESPGIGPNCICSRCGEPILAGVPISTFDENPIPTGTEWRFHPECLEIKVVPDVEIELPDDLLNPEVAAQCELVETVIRLQHRFDESETRSFKIIQELFYEEDRDLTPDQKVWLNNMIRKYKP